jgi:hypothetical protein
MICLNTRCRDDSKVFKCVFCQSVYHHSCIAKTGKPPEKACCSVDYHKEGQFCVFCGERGGFYNYGDKQNQEADDHKTSHFICQYLSKNIQNKEVDTSTNACTLCVENFSPLYACKHEPCIQKFHLACTIKRRLCLPLPLLNSISSEINLYCPLHMDDAQEASLAQYNLMYSKLATGEVKPQEVNPWDRMENSSVWLPALHRQDGNKGELSESSSTLKAIFKELNSANSKPEAVGEEGPLLVGTSMKRSPNRAMSSSKNILDEELEVKENSKLNLLQMSSEKQIVTEPEIGVSRSPSPSKNNFNLLGPKTDMVRPEETFPALQTNSQDPSLQGILSMHIDITSFPTEDSEVHPSIVALTKTINKFFAGYASRGKLPQEKLFHEVSSNPVSNLVDLFEEHKERIQGELTKRSKALDNKN